MTERGKLTEFPLKVACPECRAAAGSRCAVKKYSLGSNKEQVNWFHNSRIDKAVLNGFNQINHV